MPKKNRARPEKNCTMRREQQSPALMPTYPIAPWGVVGESERMRKLIEAHFKTLDRVDDIIPIPPDGSNPKLDAHVWLNVNGEIYECCTKAGLKEYMGLVAQQHRFRQPVELVYKEFQGELKQKVWERIWNLIIKKEIERQKTLGVDKETLFLTLAQEPQPFQCALNTWALYALLPKEDFKTRVCIGSLGIRVGDGRVFWEYG